MLFLLFSCRGYFDTVPADVLLEEIVGRWWAVMDHRSVADTLYLERTSSEDDPVEGDLWLDLVNGPVEEVRKNIHGGPWAILPDDRIHLVEEYRNTGEYTITVQESKDMAGCYDLRATSGWPVGDTVCPYEE